MDKAIVGSGLVGQRVIQGLNLRLEEVERAFLLFAVYTLTSIGLIWLELSTVGLFIDRYGADKLPWIYIATAAIGSSLGVIYSWLQRILPLRRVIVVILVLMAIPLFLFRWGLELEGIQILGLSIEFITLFLMWLWVEACYLLDNLNNSITSNQLFNIREIKRAYPIVSSGFLVAGVVSGFSLPIVLQIVGLKNITLLSGFMVVCGAGVLFYLSQRYQQFFPDSSRWIPEDEQPEFSSRDIRGPLQGYIIPLIGFFVMAEVLYVLVDFQFFSQLEYQGNSASGIVSFLGIFEGILSTFQVATQWFVSSRLVERSGVFVTAIILPVGIALFGTLSLVSGITQLLPIFVGFVVLRFLDELFHYTLIETTGAVLFQPLPDNTRSDIQTLVNGVFEPLSKGLTGFGILFLIGVSGWLFTRSTGESFHTRQSLFFILIIIALSLLWIGVVLAMRSQYVSLLVQSAERGRLGTTDVNIRRLKQSVAETLKQPKPEADKRSCIELLTQFDPKNVGDTLVPLLGELSPSLQHQSLEVMLNHPNPDHLEAVRTLTKTSLKPDVLALALRYIWLTEAAPDVAELRPYLQPQVDPIVRGTAAALILRQGDREQKAIATNTIRRMITSPHERERVMGTRALGEADYLQGLRLYLNTLLQDDSLRVRCALLDVIAATQMEEYYPSLLKALSYRSTRESARQALVRLENEAIPLLIAVAGDIYKPELIRQQAWSAIGEIGSLEALDTLVDYLMTSWGITRRNILRVLQKAPDEIGIERVLDRIGRSGLETLIEQELMFMGQVYSALIDLKLTPSFQLDDLLLSSSDEQFPRNLLYRALLSLEADAVERCFLLMKFLYVPGSIQAASFNIRSETSSNVARGLEILDNTVDITSKRALISVLDRHSETEKLESLDSLVTYRPMQPNQRLRHLLDLRHFLSDWTLACCFHLARSARWSLTAEQTLMCLRHPKGFVREAVLTYLETASKRALIELLPMLQNDPDPLVSAQVAQMMDEFDISSTPSRD